MYNKVTQAEEKWGGRNGAIDNWLSERKQLLVQYCELAGLPPFEGEGQALPSTQKITSFCASLMDYISAGHFEVYDKIAEESQSQQATKKLIDELYPDIKNTTDVALGFNDSFADSTATQDLDGFDVKLSDLGQKLELRFSMEDKLIETLYQD
ncbi:sigma D regulator [Alteromonadaceae bacterium M269]|nr:sigma D regulator [Alteromonadaceae bacterium M269]